jgi:Protein of unknown function (DUF2934)
MAKEKQQNNVDPVIPDQSGRLMLIDPLGTNAPRERLVRQKAYEIYERHGKVDGRALEHWLQAEREVQ